MSNPTSAAEQKALGSVPESLWGATRSPGDLVQVPAPPGKPWDTSLAYTATIGDACLVEIGQIVGRPYAAISYRGLASISIDSPSHDPALAYQVRAVWSSKNPAQHLLDSLLLDYSTEGTATERGVHYHEGYLQYTAVVRLLFYFPRQCAGMIARRLRGLDVSAPPSHFVSQRPWSANQLNEVARFVQTVAWCKEPVIRSALLGVFKRTTDPEVLVSALPGIGREHARLVRSRVAAFLDHRPPYVGRALEDEIKLLMAYTRWGTTGDVKAVFKRYLDHAGPERCQNACYALRETRPAWDLELLAPLLSNQRPAGGTYSIDPKQSGPRLRVRVCDEAAETLAMNHPDFSFTLAGTHEDLDRQIAAMRERISGRLR